MAQVRNLRHIDLKKALSGSPRRTPWLQLSAALEKQSIQQQQDHGANHGHDPAGKVIFSGKNATDPGTNERAGDTEQNRDNAATGIFSRHQQFRDGPDDKPDH
jgi:hypothetical protein